jgi:hypothetical protein
MQAGHAIPSAVHCKLVCMHTHMNGHAAPASSVVPDAAAAAALATASIG